MWTICGILEHEVGIYEPSQKYHILESENSKIQRIIQCGIRKQYYTAPWVYGRCMKINRPSVWKATQLRTVLSPGDVFGLQKAGDGRFGQGGILLHP